MFVLGGGVHVVVHVIVHISSLLPLFFFSGLFLTVLHSFGWDPGTGEAIHCGLGSSVPWGVRRGRSAPGIRVKGASK